MKTFGLEEKHVFTLTITVEATKAWKYLRWLAAILTLLNIHVVFHKVSLFLATDINNFRLPKGDFEIVQCSSSTCTAHVGFAWDKRGLLYHTMLSLSQI